MPKTENSGQEFSSALDQLASEFRDCRKLLLALGDENRQYLILKMMEIGSCNGIRVGTIAEETNLSRPAVSHHLRILKEAGIIKMRREGTKNYYSFNTDSQSIGQLSALHYGKFSGVSNYIALICLRKHCLNQFLFISRFLSRLLCPMRRHLPAFPQHHCLPSSR